MNPTDFGGTWQGHYEQDGARYAITMSLQQKGDRVRGTMRDLQTMMLGAVDAEQSADLRELIDLAGDAAFDYVVTLPSDSTIDGRVDGATLRFNKRYQGSQHTAFWSNDVQIDVEMPHHTVRYRGRLGRDGATIRGVWWIGGSGPTDTDAERGTFELARSNKGSESPPPK